MSEWVGGNKVVLKSVCSGLGRTRLRCSSLVLELNQQANFVIHGAGDVLNAF